MRAQRVLEKMNVSLGNDPSRPPGAWLRGGREMWALVASVRAALRGRNPQPFHESSFSFSLDLGRDHTSEVEEQ